MLQYSYIFIKPYLYSHAFVIIPSIFFIYIHIVVFYKYDKYELTLLLLSLSGRKIFRWRLILIYCSDTMNDMYELTLLLLSLSGRMIFRWRPILIYCRLLHYPHPSSHYYDYDHLGLHCHHHRRRHHQSKHRWFLRGASWLPLVVLHY